LRGKKEKSWWWSLSPVRGWSGKGYWATDNHVVGVVMVVEEVREREKEEKIVS
jgi:hypothetical protein